MRLGLTYDLQTDPQDERQEEFDPPRTVDALCSSLKELGHQVVRLGNACDLLAMPQRLGGIDLVFNMAEGSHGRCREAWVPTLLELYRIPYVGSDPLALSLGLDKVMSKRLATACDVPTPRWVVVNDPTRWDGKLSLHFPVLIKPRFEGSGIGIDEGAVVSDHQALVQRGGWLFERWKQPILIEEFIPYGELTVCVIGNDPPTAYPAIQRLIDPKTRLACHVVKRQDSAHWLCPIELSSELDVHARQLALTMFKAGGFRDVARVDLRVDEQGRLFFLEVNPLPSFDPEGSFGLLAEYLGMTYTRLIGRVLDAARSRLPAAPPDAVTRAAQAGVAGCTASMGAT